ncbi:MAG: hypothetical protein JW863_05415 [Chitinispirillaceae bacterium]|nr:hypothetical protein [Chitinispirillaceae bacterium]
MFIDLRGDNVKYSQNKESVKLLLVRAYDDRQEASEKSLSYLGNLIVGNFNKHDVHVKDNVSLSEVLTEAVGRRMVQNGISFSNYNRNRPVKAEIDYALKNSDINRILFIHINKFICETMVQVDIEWDISIRIEDRDGTVLAENESKGEKEINANVMKPGKTSEEVIPVVFEECIDSLVNATFINIVKEHL